MHYGVFINLLMASLIMATYTSPMRGYHQHFLIACEANNLLPLRCYHRLQLNSVFAEFSPKPPMPGVITSIS
jgi:hypothetical protein